MTRHTLRQNLHVWVPGLFRILITNRMECAECARLKARREALESRHAKAMAVLSASTISGIVGDFLETHKAADQAKFDLESLDAEIVQHRNGHS